MITKTYNSIVCKRPDKEMDAAQAAARFVVYRL